MRSNINNRIQIAHACSRTEAKNVFTVAVHMKCGIYGRAAKTSNFYCEKCKTVHKKFLFYGEERMTTKRFILTNCLSS